MNTKKFVVIDWQPDKSIKLSMTEQIISYVKLQIAKGHWLSGDILPPQRKMSEQLGINRSTLVAALNELSSMGLIESHIGKGSVVSNGTWSFLLKKNTPNWHTYLENGIHKSNQPTIQAINKYEFIQGNIRLSTGEVSPDLMPHDKISQALAQMSKMQIPFNYLEPLGLLELRIELCDYLKQYNIHIKPSEIMIVSGSLQAIQLISLSLLNDQSTVFLEAYSYIKSLNVLDFSNTDIKSVPMDKEGLMYWTMDEKSLSKGNTLLYTIPTFHNPTAITMSDTRRRDLMSWSRDRQVPIIEDDAYRELYFHSKPPNPLKSFDVSGNVLYLGSASKSMAPGMRIGWVVGPEPIINRLGDIKMQTDYGASSVSQWLLTIMLQNKTYSEHLIQLRGKLKLRCDYLLSLLEEHFSDLASWNKPEGGFYIWLKLNTKYPVSQLFDQALKEGVLLNPGYIYSSENNAYIRLSYSYASEVDLKKGLIILSRIIRSNTHTL